MAFSLPLPPPLDAQGWKLKIRDRERSEPPHVTVLHRRQAWRFGLRSLRFLDREPDPRDVPHQLRNHIVANLDVLRAKWDELYPANPVDSQEDRDE